MAVAQGSACSAGAMGSRDEREGGDVMPQAYAWDAAAICLKVRCDKAESERDALRAEVAMLRRGVTVQVLVDKLNEINALDPSVLPALIEYRVPCNRAMADHESVQVGETAHRDGFEVGMLGILNGIFGVGEDGWGFIQAHVDQLSGLISRFSARALSEAG